MSVIFIRYRRLTLYKTTCKGLSNKLSVIYR